MRVGAVIQARMGSTRLPGKVLLELAGRPVLAWVVDRVRRATSLDDVVVATTTAAHDDAIVELCADEQVACFRGSEADVLSRYRSVADLYSLGGVVRITADCPLMDPELIDDVVEPWRQDQDCDFVANTLVRRYPRGLDVSLMSRDALIRADTEATDPHQRTHVTPYLRDSANGFQLCSVEGPVDLSDLRWTLDEPADLEFVRAVYRRLTPFVDYSWRRVHALLEREPALAQINRSVRQKDVHDG